MSDALATALASSPTPEVPVVATPTVTDVAPKVEPKAEEGEFSKKFSALTRKEKAIYQKDQELKAREASLEKLVEERLSAKLADVKKMSPLERLKFIETDYSTITDYILNDGKASPQQEISQVRAEIEALRKERTDEQAKSELKAKEQAEAKYAQVIEDFKGEILEFVKAGAETYELINLFNAENIVYDTISEYFNTHEKVLSIKEASEMVEKYLEGEAVKASKTKRLASLSAPKEEVKAAAPTSTPTPSKTLSNQISAAPSFIGHKAETDRMQRALAKLNKQ